MKSMSLRATSAVALVLAATAAYAQAPSKDEGPAASGSKGQVQERAPASGDKAATPDKSDRKGDAARGATKAEPPADKTTKGTVEKAPEPKAKAAESPRKREGAAAKEKAASDKAASDKAASDKAASDKAAEKSGAADKATKAGTEPRAKLSDQQQTRVRETVLKQKGERVTNVNFSLTIGTPVPRSVRLAVLPPTVIEIVPEYRSYHYVVVRDDIVIIDPNTYVIVAVIPGRASTAGLSLSDEQRMFILRNVDMKADSRLGIGGISVGVEVPRSSEVREFPAAVVTQLPDVRSYRYVVIENQLGIVDPDTSKVVLVLEAR
jgi:hypothetical protein